ncbi:hypothetical protein Tco_0066026 [Tanacetum coccineum]
MLQTSNRKSKFHIPRARGTVAAISRAMASGFSCVNDIVAGAMATRVMLTSPCHGLQVSAKEEEDVGMDTREIADALQATGRKRLLQDVPRNPPVEKPLSAGKGSFASLLQKQSSKNVVHISELRNDEVVEGAAVAILLSAVEEVSARFENTLYGYFIGNRLAFPLVENYVKNTWAKFGLKRIMLDDNFFLFQFDTKEGMEKEEVKKPPVWVKMHHVPIAAYSEVGLSLITTQIGSPIMLDTYTSNMCVRSWGKKEYARALIEISAERELMESIVIAIPLGKGKGHTLATIDIDYEWKPPLCSTCKIFDHTNEKCPKLPRMNKARPNLHYRRVEKGETSSTNSEQAAKEVGEVSMRVDTIESNHVMPKESDMPLKNAFDALNDKNDDTYLYEQLHNDIINASDNEDVDEELIMKDSRGNKIVNVSRDISKTSLPDQNGSPVDATKYPMPTEIEDLKEVKKDLSLSPGKPLIGFSGSTKDSGENLVSWSSKKTRCTGAVYRGSEYVFLSVGLMPSPLECGHTRTGGIYPGTLHLDRVEVLGTSHEVSVSTEGVEEWKRIVTVKGVKEDATPYKLRQITGVMHNLSLIWRGQALPKIRLLMCNIASWNIRGLNFSPKQREVKQVIFENQLSVCAILESHVSDSNLEKLCSRVFRHWEWTSNSLSCTKGSRIIVGWNRNDVDLSSLWNNLGMHYYYVRQRPWCLLGDFNAALFLDDMTAGSSNIDIAMREFKACVNEIEVSDIQQAGLKFTWNQKPKGVDGLLKKLDRVLSNIEFNDMFQGAHAIFQPYRLSDHAPAVLKLPLKVKAKPKPFKFTNLLVKNSMFKETVSRSWNLSVSGFYMYQVVHKLKCLKKPFRILLYETGHIFDNVKKLRHDLDTVQRALDLDPFNLALREEEATYVQAFNEAILLEEKILKQKAKIDWLREGDTNSAYFHKAVKSRVSRSRIDVVTNSNGVVCENDQVPDAFVSHYEAFLGQPGIVANLNMSNLFPTRLDTVAAMDMTRMVSDMEIKNAMFSMGNEKSPGPDGFTAAFFKEAWDIVGNDVILAVREFFVNGRLLKELNHTIIALIPKVSTPARVNDFRPISCCNVLFKCISKVIANRIKSCLKDLISPNQSAFVPGRSIADNILLTQEIMHNYHLNHGAPRCAFKVDIQKAYDTVDWEFLRTILTGFGFHNRMVGWIIELDLVNLCFANDLFLFAYGNANSARVIMESLEEFKLVSGLTPSLPKSTAYFCNLTNHVKMSILQILPFEDGRLPVKYLGVPLVSSRQIYKDCKELIEKVQHRVDDWKNKSLSIASRLQLVSSAIGSLHVFWASVFMLPTHVLLDIEQIMRGFLWCQGKMRNGKAVAWEVVCLPKDEGGLGIRRLESFNKALMTTHIWKLLSRKESLWVQWIHAYKLRGRNFWDLPYRGNMTWGWRNILKLWPVIRQFIWHNLGDGLGTSLWYDRWCNQSPLAEFVSTRDMYSEGFSTSSCVCDLMCNGSLAWPNVWLSKYPTLCSIPTPNLQPDSCDTIEWRNEDGLVKVFSAHEVWSSIRPRGVKVDWCDVVWFSSSIPRHAFHLWLVIRRRLKTQDNLRPWDAAGLNIMVWHHLKGLTGLPNASDSIDAIINDIKPFAARRTSRSIIAKLVVAATTYFIWQERNGRLFKNSKRTVSQVIECIMNSVRLKLMSCRLKKTSSALVMAKD